MDNKEKKTYEKDEGFIRFSKKVKREHRVRSLLFGVAGGLLGAALSIAACRFANPSRMVYAAPTCSAVGLLGSFFAAYFIKKPTDKKIAARLDHDLQLQEKVATRVEFDGQKGLILEKQREDAKAKLDEKPVKAVKRKLASVTIPVMVLAAGLFAGSFFRPNVSQFPSHVKDPINSGNIGSVNQMVHELVSGAKQNIDNLNADDDLKDKLEDILLKAEEDLDGETDENQREQIVENAKAEVDKAVDKANSKEEIGDELSKSEDYYLKLLAEGIKDANLDKITIALDGLYDELDELSGQDLVDKLLAIVKDIRTALQDSKIPQGDPLRDALKELADTLEKEAEELKKNLDAGNDTSDQTKENLKNDLKKSEDSIADAVDKQKENEAAGDMTKTALDQRKDPTKQGQGGNSGDKQNTSGDGNGNGDQSGNGNQSGDQGNKGNDANDGNQGNQGSQGSKGDDGTGANGGNNQGGNSKGDGTDSPDGSGYGSGKGDVNYAGNDHVYTENGDTTYGDVIDDNHNDALEDSKNNNDGDESIDSAVDDYFTNLYGNDNGNKNP